MADEQSKQKSGLSIDKIVALFGLLSTIFVVATAHIGRIFANSYYTALHIPPELINISIRDYASMGSPIILLDLLLILGSALVMLLFAIIGAFLANASLRNRWTVVGVIIGIGLIVGFITSSTNFFVLTTELAVWTLFYAFPNKLAWFKSIAIQHVHIGQFSNQATIRKLFDLAGSIFMMILVIVSFFTFVVLFEQFAQDNARSRARQAMQQAGTSVRIDSSEQLSLPVTYTTTTSGTIELYTYRDLYYLTSNNDRHFFYTCLVDDTTPGPVTWLKENEGIIITSDIVHLEKPRCSATPTVAPLLAPLTTPMTPTVGLSTTPTP